jgi:hypothetical protein
MSNTYIESKQIFITPKSSETLFLLNGSKLSDVNLFMPNLIKQSNQVLYRTIKLLHAEIPYSFYVINENNNQLKINSSTIEIPLGNYNANTLVTTINQLISTNGLGNLALSFDNSTGLVSFSSSISFQIQASSIYKILGLEFTNYTSVFNFSNNKYEVKAPYLLNTGGIKNIYLKTNVITNNVNTQNDAGILKSIPVNVQPFSIIMYNNMENVESLLLNRVLNNLEIQLYDDDMELIDFNGIEWSLTLEIKTTYQLLQNQNLSNFFNNLEKIQ